MNELYNKVEAILFASGKPMTTKEIKRITKTQDKDIDKAIMSLQKRYDNTTSIMIEKQGDSWKMTIREKYIHLIRRIVTDTELTKTVMETLAVVAWKSPVTQSDIIKIRTNKAYDHLSELKEAGFIKATKHGRTKLLKLTSKFYEYFDVHGDKDIKKMLSGFSSPKLPQKKMNDFSEEIDNEIQINEDISKQTPIKIINIKPNVKEDTEIIDELILKKNIDKKIIIDNNIKKEE